MKNFDFGIALPSPCHLLADETIFGMPIWVKRDDLIHSVVSGNKYRKLKYALVKIAENSRHANGVPKLITMGGIWSNHVHATAYAAAKLGYQRLPVLRIVPQVAIADSIYKLNVHTLGATIFQHCATHRDMATY